MSKKSCILDTTLSLIKDHGFHGTSMSMIASKAGAATGTIYHHYPSKDELIKDLFRKVNNDLLEAIKISFDDSIPFKNRFFDFWKSQYHYFSAHPEVLFFSEQFMSSPYYSPEEQDCLNDLFKEIKDFFTDGIEKQHIKNLNKEILSPVVRGSIIATARLHHSGKHQFEEEDLDKIVELVWCGIKN